LAFCLLAGTKAFSASASGGLSALIVDEAGKPLADVFVSVLSRTVDSAFPTHARTDTTGKVDLRDLAAGTYQITVRSAEYRNPASRLVEILPDRTAVITLILQQLLNIQPENENIGLKALLRSGSERRLVFRGLPGGPPGSAERKPWSVEEAVFQIYTNGGPSDDYFVVPGDSWGGTTSNFAAELNSGNSQSKHIVAGQLNSGSDSLWRIKNQVEYALSENRTLRLFMGYGRVSFEQPSMSLLDNPVGLDEHAEFARVSGRSRLINLGFEDSMRFGPALSLTWGIEIDQLRASETTSFISPSATVRYEPVNGTELSIATGSLRSTAGNTVVLPDGEQVNLSTPLHLAQIGNELLYGTERHWIGTLRQRVGDKSEVEVALFRSRPLGASMPIMAMMPENEGAEFIRLEDGQAESRGCRVAVRRSLGENFKAEVSYLHGTAPLLGENGIPALFMGVKDSVRAGSFHGLATQWDAYVPATGTYITALVKFVPSVDPLVTVDPLADVRETGNEGLNLFVRQIIPVPSEWVRFFGLDPTSLPQIEALVDVRNLLNDQIGNLQTGEGQVSLVHNPRSFRGGLAVRF